MANNPLRIQILPTTDRDYYFILLNFHFSDLGITRMTNLIARDDIFLDMPHTAREVRQILPPTSLVARFALWWVLRFHDHGLWHKTQQRAMGNLPS